MTTRRLGVARAFVDAGWVSGDVRIDDDGTISAVGVHPASGRHTAVAGFVDLQVNGFAGVDFSDCDLDGHRAASTALARAGVTSYVTTIPTAEPARYPAVLSTSRRAVADKAPGARSIGVHLEGPFLTRAGAHRPEWLQPASAELCDRYLAAAPVVMVTVAPDGRGALDLVDHIARKGVVVSIGHTNADAACCHRAFDRGACAVTHLWNAQSAPTARAPGVVGVALSRPDVYVGVIADLVHVAVETLRFSLVASGDRAFVMSDASALAGLDPSSDRRSDARASLAADGAVRLADGTLAGSAAGLDVGFRNLVAVGVGIERALGCVSHTPARLLRRPDLGRLVPGARADVVVLDDALNVTRTLIDGHPVDEA